MAEGNTTASSDAVVAARKEIRPVTDDSAPDLSWVAESIARLRKTYDSGRTRPLEYRERQLDGLLRLLDENENAIIESVVADIGKPRLEAWAVEVQGVRNRVEVLRKNLRRWVKRQKTKTVLQAQPGQSFVHTEPLGVVLVIAPWNYPYELSLTPLAGALAAGNAVALKPSEVAPASSALMAKLLPRYLDPASVEVIEGGIPETTELLAQKFDHIFYTGNGKVGRIVMTAAAKQLTPVTLELGGKSPCIVDETADLEVAARRIAWGKWLNAGQTCVAPDYVLVHRDVKHALLRLLAETVREFYGRDPQSTKDYCRIVNNRHHRRLVSLLESGGDVVFGGKVDESDLYIEPTVLTNIPDDAPIMEEEIFGPLLPVIAVDDLDHAISFINGRPKALALYLFSADRSHHEAVIERTSSGGVAINQTVMQYLGPYLPFGGVGESGMGAYHGKHSVDTFSHKKSVLVRPTFVDPKVIYPPFDSSRELWLRFLL